MFSSLAVGGGGCCCGEVMSGFGGLQGRLQGVHSGAALEHRVSAAVVRSGWEAGWHLMR